MAVPTTRATFKEYCLRKLGKPVIEINVDDDQIDDRIDESLRYYWDYHFDGSHKTYYKHIVTEQNKLDKYITMPENIIGAINIFDIGDAVNTNNLFNIRYQIALNDMYTLTSQSMVPYFMAMQHIQFLEELLVGKQPIRYERHRDRLHIDMDWNKIEAGQYIIVEAYEIVDPDEWTDAWADRWLQNYCTVLIAENWGRNLTKFTGLNLPGGVQFNGEKILDDARAERQKLEDEMLNSFSLPNIDMIG